MTLGLLTPSYAPDFERFQLLHRSVLECTTPDVVHEVVVSDGDLPRFATIRSDRLRVTGYSDLLPPWFIDTDWFARAVARIPGAPRGARFIAVNARHPWPPLRGWLLQQIIKLAAASRSDAETLVLVDSDTQFIAPVHEERFRDESGVRYFRTPGGIHAGMTRHLRWHRNARRMLALPDDGPPPYDDPIAGLVAWDPAIVRGLLHRLAEVGQRPWEDTIARHWELSEYVLYGQYRSLLPSQPEGTDRSGCLTWWGPGPLTEELAARLQSEAHPDDVALVIQSTSGTPVADAARVAERLRARR